jgi:hypothetical protein
MTSISDHLSAVSRLSHEGFKVQEKKAYNRNFEFLRQSHRLSTCQETGNIVHDVISAPQSSKFTVSQTVSGMRYITNNFDMKTGEKDSSPTTDKV